MIWSIFFFKALKKLSIIQCYAKSNLPLKTVFSTINLLGNYISIWCCTLIGEWRSRWHSVIKSLYSTPILRFFVQSTHFAASIWLFPYTQTSLKRQNNITTDHIFHGRRQVCSNSISMHLLNESGNHEPQTQLCFVEDYIAWAPCTGSQIIDAVRLIASICRHNSGQTTSIRCIKRGNISIRIHCVVFQVANCVCSMGIQLQSSRLYFMPKIVSHFGKELTLVQIQCDASFV